MTLWRTLLGRLWHSLRQNLMLVALLGSAFAAMLMSIGLSWQAYQPLPYPQSDKLVWLQGDMLDEHDKTIMENAISTPVAWLLAQDKQLFDKASAVFYSHSLLRGSVVEPRVETTYVSDDFFSLFDITLKEGRWFSQSDVLGTAPNEIVVTECFVQQHFPDENMIEQSVQLDERRYTVVGVAACDESEPQLYQSNRMSEVFLPFALMMGDRITGMDHLAVRSDLFLVGRIKQGNVQAQLTLLQTQFQAAFEQAQLEQAISGRATLRFSLLPLADKLKGQLRTTTQWLAFAGVGLLIITLVNAFSLYLLDFKSKQNQLALAIVLGAKRGNLQLEQWCYIALIFLFASLFAIGIAKAGVWLMQFWTKEALAHVVWLTLPWWSFLLVVVFAQLCALVFVKLAMSQVSFKDIRSQLSGSGKGQVKQLPKSMSQALLGLQIGVGIVTMSFAFWLLSYFGGQLNTSSGFNSNNLYFVELQQSNYERSSDAIQARYNQAMINLSALRQHPSVESAALAGVLPHEFVFLESLSLVDDGSDSVVAYLQLSGPSYFSTSGQRFIAGGGFSEDDLAINSSGKKVVLNQLLAQRLGVTAADIGMTIYDKNQRPITLVGIVENTFSHTSQAQALAYLPFNFISGNILVRAKAGEKLDLHTITALYKQQNPSQSILKLVDIKLRMQQLNKTAMLSFLAGLVTALMMLIQVVAGMYGLLGYLAILSAPIFNIKRLVGAKTIDILIEQCQNRVPLIAVAVVIAVCFSLVIASIFGIFSGQLGIYLLLAVVLIGSFILALEFHHVAKQI
ncbi:ABC transporter permease [Pseudoalteromonas galatheae]|uniref:ABC transporter permease n=1 Tax=Pseudoalteromonas galatheae TaxID=579562 RepID=UPI0030D50F0B